MSAKGSVEADVKRQASVRNQPKPAEPKEPKYHAWNRPKVTRDPNVARRLQQGYYVPPPTFIRQSQRETTLIHHLPTIRRNQRDQLMDIVMNAEAIMMTTASDVPRPLIVSNALREYQTTLSEKQRD